MNVVELTEADFAFISSLKLFCNQINIMEEFVVLVDEMDNEIGIMEKQQAHVEGKLHRAISVFIFDNKGNFLLQQRAFTKYHSGGLWTNTCCSHPRKGEDTLVAANRRLFEEMGIYCELKEIFHFIYKADFENNLTEHEFDHVFMGVTDAIPNPAPEEVYSYKYIDNQELENDITINSNNYTAWFKICLPHLKQFLTGTKQG